MELFIDGVSQGVLNASIDRLELPMVSIKSFKLTAKALVINACDTYQYSEGIMHLVTFVPQAGKKLEVYTHMSMWMDVWSTRYNDVTREGYGMMFVHRLERLLNKDVPSFKDKTFEHCRYVYVFFGDDSISGDGLVMTIDNSYDVETPDHPQLFIFEE